MLCNPVFNGYRGHLPIVIQQKNMIKYIAIVQYGPENVDLIKRLSFFREGKKTEKQIQQEIKDLYNEMNT